MAIFLRSLYDEYCWIIIKLRDEVSCVAISEARRKKSGSIAKRVWRTRNLVSSDGGKVFDRDKNKTLSNVVTGEFEISKSWKLYGILTYLKRGIRIYVEFIL